MKITLDVVTLSAQVILDDIGEVAPNVRLNSFIMPNEHNGHSTVEVEGDETDLADLCSFWGYEWEDILESLQ